MSDDAAIPDLILAAQRWPTNAELIADVAKLGYLDPDLPLLDPTFENGIWWKEWQPLHLTALHRPSDGSDFRALPYPDQSWPQIAYDPPYCAMGSQKSSTLQNYNSRYGRDVVESSPASVQRLINEGLTEMWRLVTPGGYVLVKCADYVFNGDLWLGTHWTLTHAIELGFICDERFEMYDEIASAQPKRSLCRRCGVSIQRREDHETWTDLKRSGGGASAVCRRPHRFAPHEPTPGLSTQDHAARNVSTLFVLRRPTQGRPKQYRTFSCPSARSTDAPTPHGRVDGVPPTTPDGNGQGALNLTCRSSAGHPRARRATQQNNESANSRAVARGTRKTPSSGSRTSRSAAPDEPIPYCEPDKIRGNATGAESGPVIRRGAANLLSVVDPLPTASQWTLSSRCCPKDAVSVACKTRSSARTSTSTTTTPAAMATDHAAHVSAASSATATTRRSSVISTALA